MTQHEIFTKIKKLRLSKKYRGDRAWRNYWIKTNRSEKLLNKIFKSIKDKICLKEALSQFVISDITSLEVYCKDIFLEFFKFCKNDKEILRRCCKDKLVDKNFNIEDLMIINDEQIDIPEIILGCQNFQNLDNINKVFSTITGEKIFDLLNKNEFYKGKPKNYTPQLDSDWYPKLKEYLDLRHTITHDFNPRLKIDRERVDELHYNLIFFVIALDICLDWNFIQQNLRSEYKVKSVRKSKLKM